MGLVMSLYYVKLVTLFRAMLRTWNRTPTQSLGFHGSHCFSQMLIPAMKRFVICFGRNCLTSNQNGSRDGWVRCSDATSVLWDPLKQECSKILKALVQIKRFLNSLIMNDWKVERLPGDKIMLSSLLNNVFIFHEIEVLNCIFFLRPGWKGDQKRKQTKEDQTA